MSDNDHNDGNDNVTRLPSALDRIGRTAPEGGQEFNAGRKEYEAAWAPPGNKTRDPEAEAFFWNKSGNLAWAVPYHAMRKLQFTDGVVTFIYEGDKFTLKGFNLQGLFIELGLKRWRHLREYNPDYHETTREELRAEGKTCIEALTVEPATD